MRFSLYSLTYVLQFYYELTFLLGVGDEGWGCLMARFSCFPVTIHPPPPFYTTKCQLIEMRSSEKVSVKNLNSDKINDRQISLHSV